MDVRETRSRRLERWRSMAICRNWLVLMAAFVVVCLTSWQQAEALTAVSDVNALKALRLAWGGAGMTPFTGNDPCSDLSSWLVCDKNGAVTQLNLANSDLSGEIPPVIGQLASLEALELSLNPSLTGSLPPELGKLTKLTSLSIQQCGITGRIPKDLGNLVNLEFLGLNGNALSGPIPSSIGNLSKLYWFDISDNFISGALPISSDSSDNLGLDTLRAIKHFHFNNNSMSGVIPAEIFNVPTLIHLLLDGNAFVGEIPSNISKSKVQILRLDNNLLDGPIPPTLGDIQSLYEIHLRNNSLNGTLPDLSTIQGLKLLDVSSNVFDEQPIPVWLTSMPSLLTLLGRDANFVGQIPAGVFNNLAIEKVDFSENKLNGTLNFVGNMGAFLEYINLQKNQITGMTGQPESNGVARTLKQLSLAGNPVCSNTFAPLPPQFCQASIEVGSSWVLTTTCKLLCPAAGQTLNPSKCECSKALVCDMRLNSPPFSDITEERMSTLAGHFAAFFNDQQPPAPNQVVLKPDQVLVNSANLTTNGRMDFTMVFFPDSKPLIKSDVSYITGYLSNNTQHLNSTEGPYILVSFTPPPYDVSSSSKISTGALLGIIIGAVLAIVIIIFIAVYAHIQKRRADRAGVNTNPFASWGGGGSDNGAAPQLKGARWFSVSELKKGTGNFAESNELGSGGYGKVYKAVLPSGEAVAVKRAQEGSKQGATEFKNEIELLSRVHHMNLVGLLGFCYEQGEQMLVYELMVNGTLRDHLLGRYEFPLTWQKRKDIALGSGKGLAYLHELANPPIIHRDVKSTNILLDERMVAKVADFGLSKLAPENGEGKAHISTQVKGTLGYLDPEYYTTQRLTDKSDVYSFGVVMLELLTARAPIERGKYIVREIKTALDKGGIQALRPMLDPFMNECPTPELDDFLNLALSCVEEAADKRPTMNAVVKELERIIGHSSTGSAHGDGNKQKGLYGDSDYFNKDSASFQYSGGFTPIDLEPK